MKDAKVKVKYPRPDWVIETIKKLREIYDGTIQAKFVNGTWQARKVWSVWDKNKKKPVKKEEYLGVIKEDGFIPKRRSYRRNTKKEKRNVKNNAEKNVKENVKKTPEKPKIEVKHAGWEQEQSYVYGADRVGKEALKGVWKQIEEKFEAYEADMIKGLSLSWGVWGVLPLKSTYRFWNRLWSQREINISLQPQVISELLEKIGRRPFARYSIGSYFLSLHPDKPLLFDMTHLFTFSEGIDSSCYGWNAEKKWLPQVRTGVLSSGDRPVLLELAGGNLHELHMIKHMQESLPDNITNPLILVSDRACSSKKFIGELLEKGQQFVLPLRKNMVKEEEYKGYPGGFFKFCKRRVGWRELSDEIGGNKVRLLLYHDSVLGGHQVNTYRARYMDEGKDISWLKERELRAGWIAIYTNTDMSAKEVFEVYKMRQHVEEVIDRLRNHLLAEGSYMRDDYKLQGWLWITLLALQVHWYILDRLRVQGLLSRWSVEDVLRELREIRKEPTPAGWRLTPVSNSVKKLLSKMELDKLIWA